MNNFVNNFASTDLSAHLSIVSVTGLSTFVTIVKRILLNGFPSSPLSPKISVKEIGYSHRVLGFMTPSLANFMWSLLAGVVIVVIPATVFLVFISQRDKVIRR